MTEAVETPAPTGLLAKVAYGVGALGLLGAMAADFAGVAGRHLGHPVPGVIELVQVGVVLAASGALIGATLTGSHAAVHLVTERLGPLARGWLGRHAALIGAAFFAAICAGGLWILSDTWRLGEISDLLQVPIAPLRVIWALSTGTTALIFLARSAWPAPAGAPS